MSVQTTEGQPLFAPDPDAQSVVPSPAVPFDNSGKQVAVCRKVQVNQEVFAWLAQSGTGASGATFRQDDAGASVRCAL